MLLEMNWDNCFQSCHNIDEIYDAFLSFLHFVIESCTPLRKTRFTATALHSHLQRLAIKKQFHRRRRFQPGGLLAFNKCAKKKNAQNLQKTAKSDISVLEIKKPSFT